MIKIAGTGHRSDKLFGTWQIPNIRYNQISWKVKNLLEKELKPDICMSGMAQGYDYILANVCCYLSIPWIAAVPFKGQEKAWPKEAQERYFKLLEKAKEVIIVSEGGYSVAKMQIRNCYMVDWLDQPTDLLLSCWDGSKGGTANCIKYAQEKEKNIFNLNPKSLEFNQLIY